MRFFARKKKNRNIKRDKILKKKNYIVFSRRIQNVKQENT